MTVSHTRNIACIGYCSYVVGETHGSEAESIRVTAELWRENVTAYVGPQKTCVHEARMAASFNLPMISHFCEEAETSDKVSDRARATN